MLSVCCIVLVACLASSPCCHSHWFATHQDTTFSIINYMKSSCATMGQIRGMVYIRYHFAMLNLDWIQARKSISQPDILQQLKCSAIVFDGVAVGINGALFCPQRPQEKPHNWSPVSDTMPRLLTDGSPFQARAMLPAVKIRTLLLSLLTDKVGITDKENETLHAWLRQHRPTLLPFITLIEHEGSFHLDTSVNQKRLRPLLLHWASGAPEIVVLGVLVIPTVDKIVNLQPPLVSVEDATLFSRVSPALSCLLQFSAIHDNTHGVEEMRELTQGVTLSDEVLSLWRVMLDLAKKCFHPASGKPTTRGFKPPWNEEWEW